MDLETDEPRTVKIEWRIENFTCWMSHFHEPYIESPHSPSLPDFKVSLNSSQLTKEMNVSCSFGKLHHYEGELSFFGPNGLLIQTVEIMPVKEADENPVIISAPDLMEIATSQQADHGDHVILLFWFKVEDALMGVGMCTTLEVLSDMVLTFTGSKLLEDSQLGEKPKLLMAITYNRPCENGGEEEEQVNLERVFYGSRMVELQLRPVTNWAFHNILIRFTLELFDQANTLIKSDELYHIFKRVENKGREPWTISDMLRRNDLSVEGSRVVLHMKFISGKTKSSTNSEIYEEFTFVSSERSSPEPLNDHPPPFNEKENASSLKKELMCLYQDKEFTDFELCCEDITFPVHKAILSARSPFFKQLLLSNMKDEAFGSVDIEDLDAVTLNQFLAFLYTGTVDNLQAESAIKLYYAGDKYQVPTLKAESVTFLSNNISVSNACSILSLADKYKDAQLTSSAQNFIKDNFKGVAKSEEWHSYMISDPHLLVKTVSDIAAKGHFNNCFIRKQ